MSGTKYAFNVFLKRNDSTKFSSTQHNNSFIFLTADDRINCSGYIGPTDAWLPNGHPLIYFNRNVWNVDGHTAMGMGAEDPKEQYLTGIVSNSQLS